MTPSFRFPLRAGGTDGLGSPREAGGTYGGGKLLTLTAQLVLVPRLSIGELAQTGFAVGGRNALAHGETHTQIDGGATCAAGFGCWGC